MQNRIIISLLTLALLFMAGCGKTQTASVSSSEVSGKTVITVGFTGDSDFTLFDDEIDSFNASQDEYELQKKPYIQEDTGDGTDPAEVCRQRLLDDLKNGEGPDIIDLASFNLDVRDPEINVYLEDLYPYLDGDEELSREDFLPAFLSAYEVDGALYSTAGSLILNAIPVSDAVTENGVWNISMLSDTAAAVGGADHLSYVCQTKDVLFCKLIGVFAYDFMDTEDSAGFDSAAYRTLLETCGQVTAEFYSGTDTDERGVLYLDQISNLYYPELYEACFGTTFTFASTLDGEAASCWSDPFEKLAMNNSSAHKEVIWSFLRTFLTEEHQRGTSAFPINLDALNAMMESAKQDVLDTPVTSFDSSDIAYGPLTDRQAEMMMNLITSTTNIESDAHSQCVETAREIAQEYFDGDIDLDDAVQETEEQFTKILSE